MSVLSLEHLEHISAGPMVAVCSGEPGRSLLANARSGSMPLFQTVTSEGHLLWQNLPNIGTRAELISSMKSEAEGRLQKRLLLHKQ